MTIVLDAYNNTSIKQLDQKRSAKPIYITSMMQKMPKQDDWNKFLNNEENKSELEKPLSIIINLNQ